MEIFFVDGDYIAFISPGYRFNLGDQGYISASFDYGMSNSGTNNKIFSYEISGEYYPEKGKVYGEIIIPNKEAVPSGQTVYIAGANFKADDNLVCGSYRFADSFGTGIEYLKYSSEDQGVLSARMDFYSEGGVLEVGFIPENTAAGQDQVIMASYKMKL